jgi:hypothetical protein
MDKRAIVISNGASIWDDLMEAPRWPAIVVDEAGLRHPIAIDVWVSALPEFPEFIDQRFMNGFDMRFLAFSREPGVAPESGHKIFECETDIGAAPTVSGSEALAVIQAVKMGYSELILCGFEAKRRQKSAAGLWLSHMKELEPVVRSMSGWTREIFGGPYE